MTDPATTSILLVDDEATLREPLAEYLTGQGFVVGEVASAAAARSRLASETPDIVLLDIMMPGEDGLSLCRHLVENRRLPVILLTARGEATDRIVGLEIGADDYVTKPFEPRELVARIRSVLRRAGRSEAPGSSEQGYSFDGWTLDPLKQCLADKAARDQSHRLSQPRSRRGLHRRRSGSRRREPSGYSRDCDCRSRSCAASG